METWILHGRIREPRVTWEETRDKRRGSGEAERWDGNKRVCKELPRRQRGRHHQDSARDSPEGRGAGITRIM